MEPVEQAYGAMAERYIEAFGHRDQVHPGDLALIVGHLGTLVGPVLDAGCGPGHLTAHLRSLGVASTGIDLVPAFLDHGRAADPDGRHVQASMRRLPLADGCASGLLSWYSLIHLPPDELDPVLAELRRVLAPGATAVVGFFPGASLEPFDHKVATAWSWPVDDLSARLDQAGFAELERRQEPAGVHGPRAHAVLVATAT
ncbi:methyltransferase domain-containing protein [Aquihabitans sp. G128]|uniref:class I SAM-dependent methyltransferase n=1 Tax=Aquihabitans sp. G128 TaxID=2849779 RepID=UPI001C223F55|nr:class I SAM-dependent methyltransferase [Aquihabitans sp. G128]QXC62236.1 methyltransferase domain-containing protein [Aquihabitans sp. G128]